jgi:hypothetical protein
MVADQVMPTVCRVSTNVVLTVASDELLQRIKQCALAYGIAKGYSIQLPSITSRAAVIVAAGLTSPLGKNTQ